MCNPITKICAAAGTIVQIGDRVRGFSVGDRVGFLPSRDSCSKCSLHEHIIQHRNYILNARKTTVLNVTLGIIIIAPRDQFKDLMNNMEDSLSTLLRILSSVLRSQMHYPLRSK